MSNRQRYFPVMGVMLDSGVVSDPVRAAALLQDGRGEIASWPGGEVLFYFDTQNRNVVYNNDVEYKYLVDGDKHTAFELIKKARRLHGFRGSDTRGAAQVLLANGHRVGENPQPTIKHNVR